MKILILSPAPLNILPSQRFRFEQYIHLSGNEVPEFVHKPFYSTSVSTLLYQKGHAAKKAWGVFASFMKRFGIFFSLRRYSFVYIHREAASVGPPVFEWLIAKIFRKKIIYDFDDAIWVNAASQANPLASKIKCTWKVKYICKWSYIVTGGNDFLADYARQFCNDVRVIPTVVDTEKRHNRVKPPTTGKLTIGWTGTFTNFVQLALIVPVMKELQQKHSFNFLIIADKDPQYEGLQYTFLPWKLDTEIDDLLKMDIGVMPLANNILEKGKCAFKAIQYMSLGIPAVVSPVGANCVVVQDKVNGFWADDFNDWFTTLEFLLQNEQQRLLISEAARKRIVDHYSVKATREMFFGLFNEKPVK